MPWEVEQIVRTGQNDMLESIQYFVQLINTCILRWIFKKWEGVVGLDGVGSG